MDKNSLNAWPEPVIRVQSLSESNLPSLPDRYIKPPSQRAVLSSSSDGEAHSTSPINNIPIVDLGNSDISVVHSQISEACRNWGFFQVINHGVSPDLMDSARETWRGFFHLPMEEKQVYANSPRTYEGYGSRLGIEKSAVLDWSDYYYLHFLPMCLKDFNKWPSLPSSIREVMDEYGKELVKLSGRLMKIFSINLGLEENELQKAFVGGEEDEEIGACLRVNYYPKCPQPELAMGLSSHSDPGGLTILLPDNQVVGLQVRKGPHWITVKPVPHAFIVNIGDQIQVLSNARYKSVEHRVVVNSMRERLSLAFFYNPKSDIPISPLKQLVSSQTPPLYPPMTFDQYRLYIRTQGPRGKSHVNSLRSPR